MPLVNDPGSKTPPKSGQPVIDVRELVAPITPSTNVIKARLLLAQAIKVVDDAQSDMVSATCEDTLGLLHKLEEETLKNLYRLLDEALSCIQPRKNKKRSARTEGIAAVTPEQDKELVDLVHSGLHKEMTCAEIADYVFGRACHLGWVSIRTREIEQAMGK